MSFLRAVVADARARPGSSPAEAPAAPGMNAVPGVAAGESQLFEGTAGQPAIDVGRAAPAESESSLPAQAPSRPTAATTIAGNTGGNTDGDRRGIDMGGLVQQAEEPGHAPHPPRHASANPTSAASVTADSVAGPVAAGATHERGESAPTERIVTITPPAATVEESFIHGAGSTRPTDGGLAPPAPGGEDEPVSSVDQRAAPPSDQPHVADVLSAAVLSPATLEDVAVNREAESAPAGKWPESARVPTEPPSVDAATASSGTSESTSPAIGARVAVEHDQGGRTPATTPREMATSTGRERQVPWDLPDDDRTGPGVSPTVAQLEPNAAVVLDPGSPDVAPPSPAPTAAATLEAPASPTHSAPRAHRSAASPLPRTAEPGTPSAPVPEASSATLLAGVRPDASVRAVIAAPSPPPPGGVQIGQVDVFIEAPATGSVKPASATPADDKASRHYVRRL